VRLDSEALAVHLSIVAILTSNILYLPLDIWNRLKISAPTPLTSLLVIFGYAFDIVLLAMTVTGRFWQPSPNIVLLHFVWVEASLVIVFFYFKGHFLAKNE
jgi:hypothetical protein